MAETPGRTAVRIFTTPDASCGAGTTWATAIGFIHKRLHHRFNGRVAVEHVEIFSQRSFEFPAVLAAIQGGAQLPIVLVGDRIVSEGGKVSEPQIARAIEALGPTGPAEPRRE